MLLKKAINELTSSQNSACIKILENAQLFKYLHHINDPKKKKKEEVKAKH